MKSFTRALESVMASNNAIVRNITIRAGASPDGDTEDNMLLSQMRASQMDTLLRQRIPVHPDSIRVIPLGEDWESLKATLSRMREPWSADALEIIRNTPLDATNEQGEKTYSRKKKLRTLMDGAPWQYLKENVFPEVCAVGRVEVVLESGAPQAMAPNVTTEVLAASEAPELQTDPSLDTLLIRFRLDSYAVDLDYQGNRGRLMQFLSHYSQTWGTAEDPTNIKLDIYAGASPEGSAEHNFMLGAQRGESIRQLLLEHIPGYAGQIETHNQAARWQDLYDSVASSSEPWRDQVLEILALPLSPDPQVRDTRETLLRELNDGTVWPELRRKYLPPLRSGGGAGGSVVVGFAQPRTDTLTIYSYQRDTVYIHESHRDTMVIIHEIPVGGRRPKVRRERRPVPQVPAWAVKTNLLYWGVVAPNVQVEIPLGRRNRWSLEIDYDHPWYIWGNNSHASQILNLGVELRLWLGKRNYHPFLDGWHMGIAVGGGKYDWEWKQHEGWQGEHLYLSYNVGYQFRFGKHWAIDAGLGVGGVASQYRHYFGGSVYPENHLEDWDRHLIWSDTGRFLWPSPTHARISIVYLFNNWPFRFKTIKPYEDQ